LEIMLKGPRLRFAQDSVIAVTGGDFPVCVDGVPVRMWENVAVPKGGEVDIGIARQGLRGYLAIAGGIDVPVWLGSRATYVRCGQGGLDGRPLAKGDRLTLIDERRIVAGAQCLRVPSDLRPDFSNQAVLRVVLGPQDHLIESASVNDFFATSWKLSSTSDRMGFRLNGAQLTFRPRSDYLAREAGALPSNVVLDVTPIGGIQITSGTEAIVMGVEAPSLGGYAKLGTVISTDLDRLGQVRPGQSLRFEVIPVDDAVCVATRRADDVVTRVLEDVY
jgi:biotin-dependent carboxylase-like uncharacterized protein